MQFVRSESDRMPISPEETKDGRVYIRKNISEIKREDGSSYFVYDEALVSNVEYAANTAVEEMEMKREADIKDEYTLALINEGVL